MFNVKTVNTASRTNTTHFWNEDNSICVRVEVRPGMMELKLERQAGTLLFSTRHGHTLDEVTVRALTLVQAEDLKTARNLFRAMQGGVPDEMKDGRKFRCLA